MELSLCQPKETKYSNYLELHSFTTITHVLQADHAHLKYIGLDLVEGTVRDNKKAGVLEPTISKVKSLKFATEAAITILRIDDMIKLDPEEKNSKNYRDAMESGELYD